MPVIEPRQRLARLQMFIEERGEPVDVPQIPGPLGVLPRVPLALQGGSQVHDVWSEHVDQVQARRQERTQDAVVQWLGFDHHLRPGGRPGDFPG
ncbi:hypothetical protein [Streptomyces javensis]|uniref:hypothetical protein n=1 Tax=Streptomyces javensis TaxID=114698 RepID=UPI0031F88AE8